MLFELYKANAAKAPKNEHKTLSLSKPCQKSPTAAETEPSSIVAIATNCSAVDNSNDAASKNLPGDEVMPESNAQAKEEESTILVRAESLHTATNASFHPRIKYSNVSKPVATSPKPPVVKAIPTSVLVSNTQEIDVKPLIHPTTGQVIESTSRSSVSTVIQSAPSSVTSGVMPQAAAIAAALLRDGYHNFQQQLRAQEILKLNQSSVASPLPSSVLSNTSGLTGSGGENDNGSSAGSSNGNCIRNSNSISNTHVTPTKLLENFLRQQRNEQQQQRQRHHRNSECNNEHNSSTDTNDGDDEDGDDSRYNGFDDIHLIEGCKTTGVTAAAAITAFTTNSTGQINVFPTSAPTPSDYMSDESQKFMMAAQAQVLRNLEYSLSDYGGNSPGEGEPTYECRHCGKKYRWKSTLRRHENVECGGKEPSHQCPYCPYKSKQRGNLGVHVRKHHSNLPQLASKRRSKYSVKLESSVVRTETTVVSAAATLSPMTLAGTGSANGSDDSSSKLVIDCSK